MTPPSVRTPLEMPAILKRVVEQNGAFPAVVAVFVELVEDDRAKQAAYAWSGIDLDCGLIKSDWAQGWHPVPAWRPDAAGYYEIEVKGLGARVLICLSNEPHASSEPTLNRLTAAASVVALNAHLQLQKEMEAEERERLRELRERLESTRNRLDATEAVARTGSFRWDPSTGHQVWSRMNYELHGYDHSVGPVSYEMCLDRLHPDDREAFLATVDAAVADQREVDVEYRLVMPDGAVRYVFARAKPYRGGEWIGSLVDVTELRAADDALRLTHNALNESSRVRTFGELAASIAHELNQPLTSIRANAGAASRWLKREPPNLDKVQSSLLNIIRDARRGGDVIRNLLTMTLQSGAEFKTTQAQEVVRNVARLARPELTRQKIKLEIRSDHEPLLLNADPGQLQQVLLNLVRNSAEAVEAISDGPRLVAITCGRQGDHVHIAVEDNGCGVGQADRQKLFDPFYSTKKNGMGMGLAICRSIVRHHKGSLAYSPRAPQGSNFSIVLPAA